MADEEDMSLVIMAAHTLGHVLACRKGGIVYGEVRVSGSGDRVKGSVHIDDREFEAACADPSRGRALLVSGFAGEAAERFACDEWRYKPSGGCPEDYAVVRAARKRHPWLKQYSRGELKASARRLVRANWSWIEGNAYKLAARGHM